MPRGESNSPGAEALRAAGFAKLRPLWVPREFRDQVETAAEKYLPTVNRIKDQARDE